MDCIRRGEGLHQRRGGAAYEGQRLHQRMGGDFSQELDLIQSLFAYPTSQIALFDAATKCVAILTD